MCVYERICVSVGREGRAGSEVGLRPKVSTCHSCALKPIHLSQRLVKNGHLLLLYLQITYYDVQWHNACTNVC